MSEAEPHLHVNYCILGAGIAGLSLADALSEKGFSVAVVEKNEAGAGASGTPGALVNPATGRRAKKCWKAEQCYRAITENLEKISSHSDEPFFRNNGVLRPALTAKMARKMREQYEKTPWEEGWCRWMNEAEIKEFHPGINCVDGGLWLPVGITVDAGRYLQAYASWLRKREVSIFAGNTPEISKPGKQWHIRAGNSELTAENLVFATGYGTTEVGWWDDIPFEPIKGQLAGFTLKDGSPSFEHSISSLGYIANIGENRFIQGSTYEHDFEGLEPDDFGEQYLRKKLRQTLPDVEKNAKVESRWSAVRLSTPNYMPVLGRHREHKNLHLFAGLGSKGLLYGKFLAEHYTKHLTEDTPLFKSVNIERYYKKK